MTLFRQPKQAACGQTSQVASMSSASAPMKNLIRVPSRSSFAHNTASHESTRSNHLSRSPSKTNASLFSTRSQLSLAHQLDQALPVSREPAPPPSPRRSDFRTIQPDTALCRSASRMSMQPPGNRARSINIQRSPSQFSMMDELERSLPMPQSNSVPLARVPSNQSLFSSRSNLSHSTMASIFGPFDSRSNIARSPSCFSLIQSLHGTQSDIAKQPPTQPHAQRKAGEPTTGQRQSDLTGTEPNKAPTLTRNWYAPNEDHRTGKGKGTGKNLSRSVSEVRIHDENDKSRQEAENNEHSKATPADEASTTNNAVSQTVEMASEVQSTAEDDTAKECDASCQMESESITTETGENQHKENETLKQKPTATAEQIQPAETSNSIPAIEIVDADDDIQSLENAASDGESEQKEEAMETGESSSEQETAKSSEEETTEPSNMEIPESSGLETPLQDGPEVSASSESDDAQEASLREVGEEQVENEMTENVDPLLVPAEAPPKDVSGAQTSTTIDDAQALRVDADDPGEQSAMAEVQEEDGSEKGDVQTTGEDGEVEVSTTTANAGGATESPIEARDETRRDESERNTSAVVAHQGACQASTAVTTQSDNEQAGCSTTSIGGAGDASGASDEITIGERKRAATIAIEEDDDIAIIEEIPSPTSMPPPTTIPKKKVKKEKTKAPVVATRMTTRSMKRSGDTSAEQDNKLRKTSSDDAVHRKSKRNK